MKTVSKNSLFQSIGITKSFPGVRANENISLSVKESQIHALLGENGAGKSTLVKIFYGLLQPDKGEMVLKGSKYSPKNPKNPLRPRESTRPSFSEPRKTTPVGSLGSYL